MWDFRIFFEQNIYLVIIAIAFCFFTLWQLLWYMTVFLRVVIYKNKKYKKNIVDQYPPVSIVICAKDEYNNLKKNLPFIFDQDYPDFEVVVVNDCSEDDSKYLLQDLSVDFKNLSVVNIFKNLNFFKGKKYPLSLGIKSAKNEILLFTDADCRPKSRLWIKEMVKMYVNNETDIVIGYGAYDRFNSLLNKLIRFDTLHIAMQYLGLALIGLPYMGVGRNLSYKKSLFYKNNGFIYQYKIISGDDDLFINRVARSKNTKVAIDKNSFTMSIPKKNFKSWIRQKQRHISTSGHYKFKNKFFLGLYSFSILMFYSLFAILMSNMFYWQIVLSVFGLRLLLQWFIFNRCASKLDEKGIWFLTPVLELILLSVNLSILLFSNSKKVRW